MRFPIGIKLILTFILVAVVPIAITTLVSLKLISSNLESALQKNGMSTLRDAKSILSQYLSRAEGIAQFLANSNDIAVGMELGDVQERLDNIEDFWRLGIVEIFDSNKKLAFRSHAERKGMGWFYTAQDDEILDKALDLDTVSDYFSYSEGLVIRVSAPIIDMRTMDVLGIIVVSYPFKEVLLQDIKSRIKAEVSVQWEQTGSMISTIQNEDGQPVIRAWESAVTDFRGFNDRAVLQQEKIFLKSYLISYQTLKNKNKEPVGILSTAIDAEYLRQTKRGLYVIIFVSSGCAFLLAVFIAVVVSRTFTQPISNLVDTMESVAQGNLDKRVEVAKNDEIGDLAVKFNEMTLKLKNSFTKNESQRNEIAKLQSYLSNIIESMPSTIIAVDDKGKINQWNQAATDFTGLPAEEVRDDSLLKVFPQLSPVYSNVELAIKKVKPHRHEKVSLLMGSEYRQVDITIYPLAAKGSNGAVIRLDDVTDKVRIEEIMIQSEKMMSVGGLAAGMAHEINNPLGGILQGIQNIRRRISPDLEKNREVAEKYQINLLDLHSYLDERNILRYMDGIQKSGLRAAEIISNMLIFSRKSDSQKSPVVIAKLLEETLELAKQDYDLKKKYDFRHVEIKRHFDHHLKPVKCVETEIKQVILNLLRNATQAMLEAGVEKPCIELKTSFCRGMTQVEVKDNGPGMIDKTRKRIFEPFFTTKPVGQGTGLGLSVSYMIIANNHAGTMEVESEKGFGARFIIRLP